MQFGAAGFMNPVPDAMAPGFKYVPDINGEYTVRIQKAKQTTGLVDARGKPVRTIGAHTSEVVLRSTVKPFGVVALIESGAADEFELTRPELAIMCASHHGEDKHVRTLQAIFRRANVTQALLRCRTAGAPADALTAA